MCASKNKVSTRKPDLAKTFTNTIIALILFIFPYMVLADGNTGFYSQDPILGSTTSGAALPTPANINTLDLDKSVDLDGIPSNGPPTGDNAAFLVNPGATSHALRFGDWTMSNDGMIVGGFGDIGNVSYSDDLSGKGILQRRIVDSAGNVYLQQIMADVDDRFGNTNTFDDVGLYSESYITMNQSNVGGISAFQGIRCIATCTGVTDPKFEAVSKIRTGDFENADETIRLTHMSYLGDAWATAGTKGFTNFSDFRKAEWRQDNISLGDYWYRINETFDRQTADIYSYANLKADGEFNNLDDAAARLLASASKPAIVTDIATAKDYIQRYVEFGLDIARGWREDYDNEFNQISRSTTVSGAMVKKGSAIYNRLVPVLPDINDHTVYWEDGDRIQEYKVDQFMGTDASQTLPTNGDFPANNLLGFRLGHHQVKNLGNPELDPFHRTAPIDPDLRGIARYDWFFTANEHLMAINSHPDTGTDQFQVDDGEIWDFRNPYPELPEFGDPWPIPSL